MVHNPENESTRSILQDVMNDVSNIMRAEVRLARAEIREDLQAVTRTATMLGGAAVSGLLAAGALTACVIAALALVMPVWLAALIVGVFLALVAGGFFAGGRARMKQIKPPLQETKEQVRGDYEWVKQQIK
jgi:uncharacterized membrane protein YqjE